jgi:hypothetical protein
LDDTSESSLLTPLGQKQHYDLGQWFRERYHISLSNNVLEEYDPNQVLVESTAYERTIVSANALVLGLFPKAARGLQLFNETADLIPVYTRDRNNDLYLRAYDKCNALHDKLETLYISDVWKAMEMENMALLQRLAQNPAFTKHAKQSVQSGATKMESYIPLTELWNVFDAIHVVETECDSIEVVDGVMITSQVCQELPYPNLLASMDGNDVNATKLLANAVELLRFSPTIANNFVGGTFFHMILQRMEHMVIHNNNNTTTSRNLYITSAHYPTLLGLLNALDDTTYTDRYIPDYASALVLELYRRDKDGEHYVKIYFKSGDSLDILPIQVSTTCRTDMDEGCTFQTLWQESQSQRYTAVEWCQACNNTDVDICLQYQLQQQQQQQQVPTTSTGTLVTNNNNNNNNNDRNENYLYFITFLGGAMTTALLFLLWNYCYIAHRHNQPHDQPVIIHQQHYESDRNVV